jgi:XTP/dITP diphosphohydrolase
MEEVPEEQRGAKFVSVITMVTPEGGVVSARGELPGVILRGLVGDGGFGYDPLFYIPTEGCTMAQLTPQRKNQISHRAVALQQFLNQIHKIEENKEC